MGIKVSEISKINPYTHSSIIIQFYLVEPFKWIFGKQYAYILFLKYTQLSNS